VNHAGPFTAIGLHFIVQSTDDDMVGRIGSVLASLGADSMAEHTYELSPMGDQWRLTFDTDLVAESDSVDHCIAMLMWHINQQAVASRPDMLMVHASAAEWRGHAILLPASEESGKTTLVAGLVRAGMGYLTDEAAVLDLDGDVVHPYPKPLTIEQGSWSPLSDLAPPASSRLPQQWLVNPNGIRADAVATPVPVGLVVSPRYEPGAPTTLTPLRKSETIALVVQNSFNFAPFGRRGLEALAEIAKRCDGHQLVSGDLASAVDAVFGLAEKLREQACRPV
jgi:hypothetical protein